MGRWQQQFDALQIRHLRSSSAVHPDPLDTYALATYASSQGRLNETQALNHIHKNQDFHGPFHTPGSALFEDFCKDAIHRYCLDDIITQDKVVSLTPAFAGSSSSSSSSSSSVPGKLLTAVDHWLVGLASGQQLQAKKVIVGIGSTNNMRIPPALAHLQPTTVQCDGSSALNSSSSSSNNAESSSSSTSSGSQGSMRLLDVKVDHEPGSPAAGNASVQQQQQQQERQQQRSSLAQLGLLQPGESVLIIGGGLTSAHLAQMAASQLQQSTAADTPPSTAYQKTTANRSSSSSSSDEAAKEAQVSLLMRGPWRVKQFDVDVPFMGRLRGKRLAEFGRMHSFSQRLALIKSVLQGGSMPPEAAAWLQQLQAQGLLCVRQHAGVSAAEWDWQAGRWDVYLEDG
ncbi:hypothetical protein OEZ86_007648 [Tetradesmus obliquus]|nr:hypothetical protein OEZ86_007648 [Tetradesmus obliquus]